MNRKPKPKFKAKSKSKRRTVRFTRASRQESPEWQECVQMVERIAEYTSDTKQDTWRRFYESIGHFQRSCKTLTEEKLNLLHAAISKEYMPIQQLNDLQGDELFWARMNAVNP